MEAAIVLILLLFCIPCSALNSVIPVRSELRAGTNTSVWLSPSGIFAFGFYDTPKGYAVCIFLAGILNGTVVWTAKEKNPVLPNDVDYLSILEDKVRLFRYNYSQRGYVSYYTFASTFGAISSGSMLDNGNFVLYNSNGGVIWQTYDHPTDTLLPGQRLLTGQRLLSRASRTDLAKGVFRLKMQTDGNLVQYPIDSPDNDRYAYYSSGTGGQGDNFSLYLENDGRLYLYNGTVSFGITGGGGSVVEGSTYMARVDPDGIFRLYIRPLDGGDNSTVRWASTEDRCAPKGICGENSVCAYEGGIVACTCLPGLGERCRGEFDAQDCRDNDTTAGYEMKTVPNVTWVENYYAVEDAFTEQDCRAACLGDCNCFIASFKDSKCRKQTSQMEYGRKSTNDSNVALVRVSVSSPPPPPEAPNGSGYGKGLSRHRKGISYLYKYVITGVSMAITALVISSIIICNLTKRGFCAPDEASKENMKAVLDHCSLAPKRYSHKEIKRMTKSFTEKLGQGGYGIVYKGKLPDGKRVAVKVLTKTCDKGHDFLNEVASISRTSHVNIVSLLGFCLERKKRALVYEFMPNKSLDKFIYKRGSLNVECSLEWSKLYEIAVGVARGLEYLHRGCSTRIVHFDIKPQNILLGEDLCPKISDFGLAKLCKMRQSVISMLGTRGTIGYIAPEVFSRNFGLVSHKSDVYSYGIMLLQMVEARTNAETKSFQSCEDYFLEKVYEHVLVQNEKIYALMTEEEEEVVRKMLMVGFWCIQTAPSDRPSMNKVVDMLEGNVESIEIAPLPFLLSSPKPEFSGLQLRVIVETQSSSRS